MQRYAFFRRSAGEPLRYHAYLLNSVIAGALAAIVCAVFHLGTAALSREDVPVITLTVLLCAAVALCCDDSPEEPARPHRLRVLEALGCAAMVAFGTALLYLLELLPVAGSISGGLLATWIALPSAMALMIGGFVPHIYRRARLAAAARRDEVAPATAPKPPPRISRHATTAPLSDMAAGRLDWAPRLHRRSGRGKPKPPAKAA